MSFTALGERGGPTTIERGDSAGTASVHSGRSPSVVEGSGGYLFCGSTDHDGDPGPSFARDLLRAPAKWPAVLRAARRFRAAAAASSADVGDSG